MEVTAVQGTHIHSHSISEKVPGSKKHLSNAMPQGRATHHTLAAPRLFLPGSFSACCRRLHRQCTRPRASGPSLSAAVALWFDLSQSFFHMAVAEKTGIPKWVALVSRNMETKTCGLPLLSNFEPDPHPFQLFLSSKRSSEGAEMAPEVQSEGD